MMNEPRAELWLTMPPSLHAQPFTNVVHLYIVDNSLCCLHHNANVQFDKSLLEQLSLLICISKCHCFTLDACTTMHYANLRNSSMRFVASRCIPVHQFSINYIVGGNFCV